MHPALFISRCRRAGICLLAGALAVLTASEARTAPARPDSAQTDTAAMPARVLVYAPLQADPAAAPAGHALGDALKQLGAEPVWLTDSTLAQALQGAADPSRLLVLVNAGRLPTDALRAIDGFVAQGGDLLVIGEPPAQTLMENEGNRTITRAEYLATFTAQDSLIDWSKQDLAQWTMDPPVQSPQFQFEVQQPPADFVRLGFPRIVGDARPASPPLKNPFPAGATLTIIEARGAGPIKHLHVEWEDREGIRWFAQVPLDSKWRRTVLEPRDFGTWPGVKLKPFQQFDPASAVRLRLGITLHEVPDSTQTQVIDLRNVGCATLPAGRDVPALSAQFPEALGTRGQLYPFTPGSNAAARALLDSAEARAWAPAQAGPVFGHVLRPRALNIAPINLGRWIPWLTIEDRDAGAPDTAPADAIASSWIDLREPGKCQLWSHLGADPAAAPADGLAESLRPILAYHGANLVLFNAGPAGLQLKPDEPTSWTCRLLNRGAQPRKARLAVSLEAVGGQMPASRIEKEVELPAGRETTVQDALAPLARMPAEARIRFELRDEHGTLLDVQSARMLPEARGAATPEEIVTVAQGRFIMNGRPWYPHGVHYWLPIVVAQDSDGRKWHSWFAPELYDPDLVERDLASIAAMGFTAVVAPYRAVEEASSVSDFLARCRRHGLKCMLYIEHAHPLEYQPEHLERLIRAADLASQPALFALDLAWEPHLGPRADRSRLDQAWTEWVLEQYGSVERAQQAWKWPARHVAGIIEGPSDAEVTGDGDWRVMVAAYRRFLDDHISRNYGKVVRQVKALCPGVLVGTRTGYGGTGASWIDFAMPFDLTAGADHLDYISPEAYGLDGAWSGFLDGKLIVALARMAGRERKPVLWMEYGKSALRVGSQSWSPEALRLDVQANYFANMIRLMRESQSDGSIAWWWAGGYRVDEKSDYGLTDVRGRARPALELYSKALPDLMFDEPWARPAALLKTDRDLHPRGLSKMIECHRQEFLAREAEGRVGFTSPAEGASTIDVPLTGVGNIEPAVPGPLKYVNGEFTGVELLGADGSWKSIEPGASAGLARTSETLRLRVSGLNTGVATWAADPEAREGGVAVTIRGADGDEIHSEPLPEPVAPGERFTMEFQIAPPVAPELNLRLGSPRTGLFGQNFRLTLFTD